MASSSNFSKGEDVAEVPCRQDPSEVSTLSSRVSLLAQPCPPGYRAAFAFSDIIYPPSRPPTLRSGYHRGGGRRAYPVVAEEGWGAVGLEPLPRWGSSDVAVPRRSGTDRPTHHFGHGLSASLAVPLLRGLLGPSLAFNLPFLP